jgi:hypothetical protein
MSCLPPNFPVSCSFTLFPMSNYATYTKFHSPEQAQFLITLLQQHHIPYLFEHEVNPLDKVYIGDTLDAMFVLQIPTNRFIDVNGLLAEQAKADMAQPIFEHVLQSCSTPELREILADPTNWNAYDLQVAATLLAEQTKGQVAVAFNDADSFVPAKLELIWIILGYIVSLLGASYFFYLAAAGFLAGLTVNQAKKRLKNGTTVKMYSQSSRAHGRNMMILSTVCMVISFIIYYMAFTRRGY